MNKRQKKKRNERQQLTIILSCNTMFRAEGYEKIRKNIEQQVRAGSVVVLPAYLRVEAIIQQDGSRRIEIKHESEVVYEK
ncbi:hypothetical protein ACQRBN_06630 [Bariatricus sp. SGI.154]|uniref:hypothetical protein n=1 Tax=Bariatricus sp. SGI.154 TaxID=3420549 RepID=UPI003D008D70